MIKFWGLGLAVLVLMLIPHGNILDYAKDLFDSSSVSAISSTDYTIEQQYFYFRRGIRRTETQISIGTEKFYTDQDLLVPACGEAVKDDIFSCNGKLIELTYLKYSRRVLEVK